MLLCVCLSVCVFGSARVCVVCACVFVVCARAVCVTVTGSVCVCVFQYGLQINNLGVLLS